MSKPAEYWRHQQDLTTEIGKVGQVVAVTTIYNSTPEFNYVTPYDYLIVDFKGEKRELMGVSGESFEVGDQVQAVLRKMAQASATSLIDYGLKVQKIEEKL